MAKGRALLRGWQVSLILFSSLLAVGAQPYTSPLSANAVREAYFFGSSGDQLAVAKFLAPYKRTYEPSHELPAVYQIEFRTPYEQVVLRSKDRQTLGYSAQQAQLDYAAHPHEIVVRVVLLRSMQPGSLTISGDSSKFE
jgi:hypothetical protein